MRTPASIKGHPIHPVLIVFPIGLWVFSFICDLLYLTSTSEALLNTSLYTMIGGTLGALAAAVPGFIDFFSISNERTRKIGLMHMSLNLIIVVLYSVNILLRINDRDVYGIPMVLSLVAIGLLAISGWLGGSLVYRHGVGVNVKD
jgi:uncharacterized membrane protein